MLSDRKGTEVDIFVWVGSTAKDTPPLYSVSRGKRGVCVDVSLEEAVQRIREELEAASIQGVAA